jgi:hypothetical protein
LWAPPGGATYSGPGGPRLHPWAQFCECIPAALGRGPASCRTGSPADAELGPSGQRKGLLWVEFLASLLQVPPWSIAVASHQSPGKVGLPLFKWAARGPTLGNQTTLKAEHGGRMDPLRPTPAEWIQGVAPVCGCSGRKLGSQRRGGPPADVEGRSLYVDSPDRALCFARDLRVQGVAMFARCITRGHVLTAWPGGLRCRRLSELYSVLTAEENSRSKRLSVECRRAEPCHRSAVESGVGAKQTPARRSGNPR